jgi:poly-gamma-glutamate synthesis protein (capsule biosynthesis protein)
MSAFFLVSLFYVDSIAQDTTRISLLFAGDVMGHDSQIAAAYNKATGKYDYSRCFQFVKPYVQSADLAIGNLEVTLAGPPYKGYPQFSSPDELAAMLKEIGFDVMVTANNHSVDRGKNGIHRTIDVLDSLAIPHTGTFTDEADRLNNYPLMINQNGFLIALLNYTYGTNGIPVPAPTIVNPLDTALISADIKSAKARNPDVIIAFVHWGVEYENLPRKNQKDLAEFFFNKGVSFVIGAHPHVLQPMEWRKDKNHVVVYSLGNFVSGQRKRYTDGGAMAYVELKKVRYKPDSIVTTIDSAGYFLQWVYRTVDVRKDYYILPVTTFEKDTTAFIRDEASRTAFKTFVSDSRALYDKHNINMPEIKIPPSDSQITYKVHLVTEMLDQDSVEIFITNLIDPFFGIQVSSVVGNENLTAIGPFLDHFRAKEICLRLAQKGWPAEVKKYVDGVIME